MKIPLLFVALVALSAQFTCKNSQKPGAAAPEANAPAELSEQQKRWKASHVIEGNNPDTAFTYQVQQAPSRVDVPWQKITPPSTSRRAYLATGWWNPKMAFQASDTSVHQHYMGKTLKFHEDQTFDILQGAKVLETGHWAYEDEKKVLYIACNDTYFNNTWRVQENGFRMVWIGNTDLNYTGIQIRFDGSKTAPQ